MSFPWLTSCSTASPPGRDGAARRATAAAAELASRAAILYRLGFTEAAATRRLAAAVAWEYDPESPAAGHRRPAQLSDSGIAKIVADTFARRPG